MIYVVGIFDRVHKRVDSALSFLGALTMTKSITMSGVNANNNIIWTGTNTAATPALKFPDDTYIADADGAVGVAAGFIVVDIAGTNYKLRTYAVA